MITLAMKDEKRLEIIQDCLHNWLKARGPSLYPIGAIDDTSGKVVRAVFVEAESSGAYFELRDYINATVGVDKLASAGL